LCFFLLLFLNSDLSICSCFVVRYCIFIFLCLLSKSSKSLCLERQLVCRNQQPKSFLCRCYDGQFPRLFSAVDTNQNLFSGPYRAHYHPCVLTSLCGSLFLSVFIPSNSPNHSVTLSSVLLINFNA